jgi:hypothetical protein
MMNNLWPDYKIETKFWVEGETEPSIWNSNNPPTLVSPTGAHVSALQNSDLADGSWHIKYRIGKDVFGPFDIEVRGSYPRTAKIVDIVTLIRTDNIQLSGAGWHNLPFTDTLINREIDEAPDAVITGEGEGAVTIADLQRYSSFKVSGFCTLNAQDIGKYQLSFSRAPAGNQHNRSVGNVVMKNSDVQESLALSFESIWLPIQPGGETLFLSLNLPGDVEIDASQGIGLQIELRGPMN